MSRRRKGSGDYVVGKGRPPVATRFKPGQSGNPKGRPKKPQPVGNLIHEALQRRVRVQENGRPCTRTVEQIIIANLVNAAARQDLKAMQVLFNLRGQYEDSHETTLDSDGLALEDSAILRDYMARALEGQGRDKGPDAPNQEGLDDPNASDEPDGGGTDRQ